MYPCGLQTEPNAVLSGSHLCQTDVISWLYTALKYLYTIPASAAPAIGTRIKSQSCDNAQSPTNNAWLILLAGLTDVFVTGMLIKWINVRASPMAIPAKPLGALSSVAPKITSKNINVITNSVSIAASIL